MPVSELMATTLVNRERAGMGDAILNNNALTAYLMAKGRVKDCRGGRVIYETLAIAENATAAWYENYDTFTLGAPAEVLTAAEYDWAQGGGFAAISGKEEVMNREQWQAEDLVEGRIEVLEKSLENLLGAGCYNDGTVAKAVDGAQLLIADDPTAAGTPGGIDQATTANWRNYTSGNTAAHTTSNITSLLIAADTATQRGKDRVHVWAANSISFNAYWETVTNVQRVADRGLQDSGAGLGFRSLKFAGSDFLYDSNVPDGSGSGAVLLGRIYGINLDTYALRCAPDRKFAVGETRLIQNADYKATPVWFMGQFTCRDRARNAVIFDSGP